MCQTPPRRASPGDCHRHQLIAAPHFPCALHIFEGELIRADSLQAALDHPDPDAKYDIAGHLKRISKCK